MSSIRYKAGYKYQLVEAYSVVTRLRPPAIQTEYIGLDPEGLISIKKGYAWDGPSGPTFDTPNFMRGSLVHDACYQLMRQGKLDREVYRKAADKELKRMCRQDGMSRLRAQLVYLAVTRFAKNAASTDSAKEVMTAPR